MITKMYTAECDNCGELINYYFHRKPTLKELRRACHVKIINGKVRLICNKCMDNIDKKYKQK